MMSWLGVFYVAYRLIKEQVNRSYAKVEAERIRREHPYRTPNPDLDDPRNDEPFFTWEQQNPELVKVRQRKAKEKLEMALQSLERTQSKLNERKANGTFTVEDEQTQKSLDWHRKYYTERIEGAKKMGI